MEFKSDELGKDITYYSKKGGKTSYFKKLSEKIRENGFSGFEPKGITSFLTFRYPIGKWTMFKDYYKIPCGQKVKNNKKETYWYPRFEEKDIDFEEALEKVEELLKESVRGLIEGKKIAVPLSGGIDSSLILAICRKVCPEKKIYTYSAGFYGEDEFEYSRLIAKKFKTVHKEKVLYKEDYIGGDSLLKPLIRLKGEPLHPNEIALANVEKLAKQDGCEIAVCGEGGDDIFGGYGRNLRFYMNYNGQKPFFKFFLGSKYRYFTLEDREKIIKDSYLVDDVELLNSAMNENEIPEDVRNKMFYFIQKVHTLGLITRGANTMRFNDLELGFPYTNMKLVNFVNSLPFDFKVHWKSDKHFEKAKKMTYKEISESMDVPKFILKKIAEKYLPHKVIYRKKYGFPVPFEKWFKDLKSWSFDNDVFKSNDISSFNGWKKFMLINLDAFIKEFKQYIK